MVLGVLVVLALIAGSVLVGRWSVSTRVPPARQSVSGPSEPSSTGLVQPVTGDLPGGGVLNGGGMVCLLARPC